MKQNSKLKTFLIISATFILLNCNNNTFELLSSGQIVKTADNIPSIISITTSTPDGTYGLGAVINITVTMNEPVTLSNGTLEATLDTGDIVSVSGTYPTDILTGTYIVGLSDFSTALDAVSVGLSNGASLEDDTGNNADLTMPSITIASNSFIVIDTASPSVLSVTSSTADGSYKEGASVNVTVTMSAQVILSGGTLDVTLDTGDVISVSGSYPADILTGSYIVGAGDTSLALDSTTISLNGGTLKDSLGNNANLTMPATTIATTSAIVIDTSAPAIISAQTLDADHNGFVDHYKITFSENVQDSTFPGYIANAQGTITTDWLIAGYTNVKLAHGTAAPEVDNTDDNVIYIIFTEAASEDTGLKPDLTTSALPGLQDIAGNSISQLTTVSVTETDGAIPVVAFAEGTSNTSVEVTFSEPVQAADAEIAVNYTVTGDGGLTVSNAVMSGGSGVDGKKVVLTTFSQTVGINNYTVTVTEGAVKDLANNGVLTGFSSALFSGQPEVLRLSSASGINNTTVYITFSAAVKAPDAECSSAVACDGVIYSIAGLTVQNAAMAGGPGIDGTTVVLTTSQQLNSAVNGYTITVTGGIIRDSATGTVTCDGPDNTASFTGDKLPSIISASSIDATHVNVTFSEPVTWDASATGALLETNYAIDNGLTVSSSTSQTPTTVVQLTTLSQTASTLYTVTVSNITDTTGNTINPAANTATFLGLENIKVLSMAEIIANTATTFRILETTFSKEFITDGGANAVNNLLNWKAPAGANILGVCTSVDDTACPVSGYSNGNTIIYFKVDDGLGSPPVQGAYTFVASGWDGAAYTVAGAPGCILPNGGAEYGDCLQSNPNDRASVEFGALPTNPGDGPVYSDPFNDGVTLSGLVFTYNGKLMIGPNDTDSGIFQVDVDMLNSQTITLDADNVTAGNQAFAPPLLEDPTGNILAGIDYFYAGCYSDTLNLDSTLTGTDCSTAGGSEYLFTLGYNTDNAGGSVGYNSNWNTTNITSPFVFNHITGLSSNVTRTFRAMSIVIFKGWIYQASQHQAGTRAVRWNRFLPDGSSKPDLRGDRLNRIGEGGTIPNGQGAKIIGLISIDSMYEYDNDGAGSNESQLYIANGGSCLEAGGGLPGGSDDCLTDQVRNGTTDSDGGILRTNLTYSTFANPPLTCTSTAHCDSMWDDVTPNHSNWLKFMSIALPDDATAGGDWDALVPANTITPAIKAIPYMVSFNGDMYIIRNACSSVYTHTVATGDFISNGRKTCTAGNEVPQLWKLPAGTTASPKGSSDWAFIGNVTNGKTTMAGADWSDTINHPSYADNNTEITLLAVVGDRLYVGFDNAVNGVNIWRSKNGITSPAGESDFEAICDTNLACSDMAKQFGFGTIGDASSTNDIKRLFDKTEVTDAGVDYLVFTAGDGVNPVKVYRSTND
ncbi:MAG: Ig-like domain-containing protein [Spirochaetia bacterium]|nr:Ig-like domain-containing protein [Spirochaetia bacterium]